MERRKWSRKVMAGMAAILLMLMAGSVVGILNGVNQDPKMEHRPGNVYEDTLVVAVDVDYQPYSFYNGNGEVTGYDVELICLLAERMNRNVDIRMMQWTDACEALKDGRADILMGLDYNMNTGKEFELSLPLRNDPFIAFGKEPLKSVDELYGKRIATLEDSGSYGTFLRPFRLEGNTASYASYSEAFQAVQEGTCDYAIAMYSVGRRAVANLKRSRITATGPVLSGNYLCIGVRKGNTALMELLNDGIIQLKKEGTLDRLGDKWLGEYVEVISGAEYLKKNAPVIAIVVLTLLSVTALAAGLANRRIARVMTRQNEMTGKVLEYQKLLTEATKGLYESIYELDITHNRAGSEATEQYFMSMGMAAGTPFSQALYTIAEKQIAEEFIRGYLDTFSSQHVLEAYDRGTDRLSYDFMISSDGRNYYWMRITARIFYWPEDTSVRMIVYRQNIDTEKRKELELEERVLEDPMTGLYNRKATQELVRKKLNDGPEEEYAFVMLDIDTFKQINDSMGHAFGDYVIMEFADELRRWPDEERILGRVGGDEFIIFCRVHSRAGLENGVDRLIKSLDKEIWVDDKSCSISVSAGIALYPVDGLNFESLYRSADEALYHTKNNGKDGYTIYGTFQKQDRMA